jgi:UDPglucose 6-dehydrogenase
MRIAIIGAGYVGLVSGVCFADAGHHVVCCDNDETKLASLAEGVMPIYEPGLADLAQRNIDAGRLQFSSDMSGAVAEADAIVIAVGTPARDDGEADLSSVFSAITFIASAAKEGKVVIVKSTVPVGTGDELEALIAASAHNSELTVVSNPEFLREGQAIADFKFPHRIVVGTEKPAARELMRKLYAGHEPEKILFTSRRTAEVIKYASNSFLALKVTFINEVADLCEAAGASVTEVAAGMGMDPRIGTEFLRAGPGYGGSCFPKDTLAFASTARKLGSRLRLVETVIDVNAQRSLAMADKIIRACGGSVQGLTIGIWGLTFKANTDDMRDAPSVPILKRLISAGAQIRAYDPLGMSAAKKLMPSIEMVPNAYDAVKGAKVAVLVTDWPEFEGIDIAEVARLMDGNVFVDLRNFLERNAFNMHGLDYVSVG